MAHDSDLPCDGDGICMLCKKKPPPDETLTCKTCVTPWHFTCLRARPEALADVVQWECPDCAFVPDANPPSIAVAKPVAPAGSESAGDLMAEIRAIESDQSLTEQEKAKRRQELMSRGAKSTVTECANQNRERKIGDNDVLDLLDNSLNCSFCMQLPERPVTTPCGHNFCLKCFQKWIGQGKRTCANCRNAIPPKMASQPRINSALVIAIRMAKMSKSAIAGGPAKVYHFVHNQNRPDKAYTTERAKKAGKANACSGKIFVTMPPDHFGPILAENDPQRNQGVLVGESWEDRMECRQWGAHLPHVAGIAGQSEYGAQSVALSGGYVDDEDHGEWFLYTGSGGRDLSGNKRTNKTQSFDQKFEKLNEALRVSCKKGYPVRVVRSHKEKRSSYAPEKGVRYDGIYRIEKCWRKVGVQGFKVCRYLFVRCDNDPAPWTSDDHGDRPRSLPIIKELKNATDITERKGGTSWDYDEEKACWMWKKPPPQSRKQAECRNLEDGSGKKVRRQKQFVPARERVLKGFCCLICEKVMISPLTTPCAHNFCKACLEGAFTGQTFIRQRTCGGRRTLRAQKNVMKCPSCSSDISDFLQNPQINRELMGVIESLQRDKKGMEYNVDSSEETQNKEMEETADSTKEAVGTDEQSKTTIGDTEMCDKLEILEEDQGQEEILNSPSKIKSQRTHKRENASDDGCISQKKYVEKADAVSSDIEVSPPKPRVSDSKKLKATNIDNKITRNCKRKNAKDGICSTMPEMGVRTRSKKAKLVVVDDDFA